MDNYAFYKNGVRVLIRIKTNSKSKGSQSVNNPEILRTSPQKDDKLHPERNEGSHRIRANFKKNGFSMAEALVLLLLVSIALAVTVPVITSRTPEGVDKNVIDCILSNATGIVFDGDGHITTYPESGSCYAAYFGCQIDKQDSCNTLRFYADGQGTADQQTAALKILRASCDKGGKTACDYFLSRCVGNEANCSSPDNKLTLRYYLNLPADVANAGRAYIENKGTDYYSWNMTTFVNAVNTVCPNCGNLTACSIKGTSECSGPPDPACGAEDIGIIRVSKCNNTYNLVANNVNLGSAGCWEGLNTSCSGTGCSRPICNWTGAEQACIALNGGVDYGVKNWRLPTRDEMQQWRVTYNSASAIIASIKTALDLCDYSSSYSPYCYRYNGCSGSGNSRCYPSIMWSAEPNGSDYYDYYLDNDYWNGPDSNGPTYAYSVRCVRSL